MWHEARKQERMIRGLIVDYRRRAERRKDFYEKIKAEPTQFLQLHGRPCKIHLDPAVAAAGDSPAIMMPWQGDTSNLIDRFDVRAHLDIIQDVKHPEIPPEDLSQEERLCNYERYRILAQNVFLGISEDKFLQQLAIEEQFGVTIEEKEAQKEKLNDKKGGVAIGYNYNDLSDQPSCSIGLETKAKVEEKDSDDDSDLEIIDVDLSIDVNKMEASQAHELNAVGPHFGMTGCDLFSFLTGDADDAEHQKQVLREEKEKAMFSGRKSRRERRAHRDKKLATRVISPPSYAAPSAELPKEENKTRSLSRSPSPDVGEKIQFITSFGDDDEENQAPPPKPLYADKLKVNLKRDLLYSEVARKTRARSLSSSSESGACRPRMGPHRPKSRSFSPSRSLSRGRTISSSRSSSRSRSRSRPKYRSRSRSKYRSKSRSYSPQYRRSKSRSRSRLRNSRLRRSRSNENKTSDFSKRLDSKTVANESQGQSKPTVPRYYGRKKEDKSSSELSLDSDSSATNDDEQKKNAVGTKSNTSQNQLRLAGSSSKGSRGTMSLKDKLKKKMQAQLSRQLRADKRAEAERMDRESRRQARRDEEMRELAIKLRRKQREMRHQQYRRSSEDSDGSRSGSSSRDSVERDPKRDSRSRSDSPREKTIPVIDTRKENPPLPDRPMPPYSEASYYQNCPPRPPPEGKYYGRGSEQRNYQNRAPADELRGYNNRGTGSERGFRGPGDEHRGFPSRGPGDERSYQSRGHDNERSYQNRGHDSERSFLNRPSGIHQRDFQPKYVERPREDSKGSHDNDKREFPDYDTRWRHEGNDRRPVGHRGSFRGQSRFEGQGWQRHDDEPSGSDKSKVKLVDY